MANPERQFRIACKLLAQGLMEAASLLSEACRLNEVERRALVDRISELGRENGYLKQVVGAYRTPRPHRIPCVVCGALPAGPRFKHRCKKHRLPGVGAVQKKKAA